MNFLEKILEQIESINERANSEKQRKWACAQMGKSRKKFKGKPKLSKKEAEKMCTDPLKEDEINEYFEELSKGGKNDETRESFLNEAIENMTIEEWLDPECPAPWDEDFKGSYKK
jgi:hypothetical protein